jgi:hypothetical protein
MKVDITSFEELIEYIETNDSITVSDINKLVKETIGVRIVFYSLFDTIEKDKLVQDLKEFWNKWKDAKDRPLFLVQKESEFSIKDIFSAELSN